MNGSAQSGHDVQVHNIKMNKMFFGTHLHFEGSESYCTKKYQILEIAKTTNSE